VFCDTSTLLKYYTDEAESDAVRIRLGEAEEVTLSALGRVEMMSAFYQRLCQRLWNQEQFSRMAGKFEKDNLRQIWTWLPVDDAVIDFSARVYLQLPPGLFLRASDCIHLASALASDHMEIHTHDQRQAKAAEALGLVPIRIAGT
jgi:predicted nucleic acid-binding protein